MNDDGAPIKYRSSCLALDRAKGRRLYAIKLQRPSQPATWERLDTSGWPRRQSTGRAKRGAGGGEKEGEILGLFLSGSPGNCMHQPGGLLGETKRDPAAPSWMSSRSVANIERGGQPRELTRAIVLQPLSARQSETPCGRDREFGREAC